VNLFEHILHCGDDRDFSPRPAAEPTTARPGTPEKIEVMAARLQRGEEIFHPDDPVIEWQPSRVFHLPLRFWLERHGKRWHARRR